MFSFPKCSNQLWGALSPLFNVYQGLLAIKLLEHKPDHSPCSAEIRDEQSHTSFPSHAFITCKGTSLPSLMTLQTHQQPNSSNITTSESIQTSVKSFIHTGYFKICNEISNIKRLIAEVSLKGAFI